MERDRAAVLTLRSAAQGVIDYRQVNLHDENWWKRWRYLTQTMEETSHEKLLHRAYEFKLALVSNPRISAEDFTKMQKAAQELFSDMSGQSRPWAARDKTERDLSASTEFKARWLAGTGIDLDNPEATAKWEADVKQMFENRDNEIKETGRAAADTARAFEAKLAEVKRKRRGRK